MEQKIIYLDLDDTLLNSKKEITPENAAAIDAAIDRGHKVVLCSGRQLSATLPMARKLNLDRPGCYVISFNGSLIYDCGAQKPIYKKTLSLEDTRVAWNEAKKAGIHCQAYADVDVLTCEDDEEIHFYQDRLKITYQVDPLLPETLTEETVKLLFINLHDHEKLEAFRAKIADRFDGRLSLFFSNDWYLECVSKGVSKGFAVKYLADYLGIPAANTIAAGDQENDLPMIEAAGVGCAMANATDSLKAAADYVTAADCDHSGVAEIIRTFML